QALQDDRAALAGGNGVAIANAVIMRADVDVQSAMLNQLQPGTSFTGPPFPNAPALSADGPGFAVLVDPIGVLAYTGQPGNWSMCQCWCSAGGQLILWG